MDLSSVIAVAAIAGATVWELSRKFWNGRRSRDKGNECDVKDSPTIRTTLAKHSEQLDTVVKGVSGIHKELKGFNTRLSSLEGEHNAVMRQMGIPPHP